jgi:hypothetical protein
MLWNVEFTAINKINNLKLIKSTMSRFADLLQLSEPALAPEVSVDLEGYNENASDRDGDGLVQEGTKFERPVSTTSKKTKKK